MDLKHVVITSVTRDDLMDYGSNQFVKCIELVKEKRVGTTVEVLIPDFMGDYDSLKRVMDAKPDVLNHNLETIERLYPGFRDQATYKRSLNVLKTAKEIDPTILTKSGIMVGIGEKPEEVLALMDDLRGVGCDIITIGQYLRPSKEHVPVIEYVSLETFEMYKRKGIEKGFRYTASGPLVRSSYQALKQFKGDCDYEKNSAL
jgi:lipoic acid synthetase